MPTAKIYHNKELGAYELNLKSHNFSRDIAPIVNFIKAAIPSSDRSHDPVTKNWTVLEQYWEVVHQLIAAAHYHIIFQTKDAKVEEAQYRENFFYHPTPSANTESASSIAEKLGAFLGVEITTQQIQDLKRLYRMKAREYHPDLGGDAAKMSELNRLWTLYEKGGSVQ